MLANGGEPLRRRALAPLLILLLLTLLAFWLRVHNLDAFSFWTDEGLTPERSGYSIAQILRNDILIQGVVTKDTHPPLYYLIIHVTRRLFGASDFAFRYPSVLFGVLLVPLLYQLGQRMGGKAVGLIVALLAAVSPLQVYYSQEARMYSLLALLVTAMSYVLWRVIQLTDEAGRTTTNPRTAATRGPRSVVRGLGAYALLASAALYTHYTVAFLIAVQALFWGWVLWRVGLKWIILVAAGLGLIAAIPLVPYTIPRLLAGPEANYYRVAPLTMLLDVVRFFNLGLTVDFTRPLIIALNVMAFALLLLGLWAAAGYEIPNPENDNAAPDLAFSIRHSPFTIRPLFLISWLLAVVLGLMAGSLLIKPMYQGVRHIMAGSPAFLLLIAFGIGAIWNWLPDRWREPAQADAGERTGWSAWVAEAPRLNPLAFIPLGLLLIGALLALVNLYTNPAYVKDDFRAIVRFIETRAGNRDAIVYNNAVLLPLHEHYRQRNDITVTALPTYPQLATGAEPELAALQRDYDRVWFITDPPADKRDERRLIQGWLDANLTRTLNRLFPARTTEARVIAYSSAVGSRPSTAMRGEFAGLPTLTGVAFDSPLALPTLWVDLIWQGERPIFNASLLFTLTGPDGREYHREARPILPDDDTRWDETGENRIGYNLPLPPGLPPGRYALVLTPEGNEPLSLGTVEIAATTDWPVAPEALFGDGELSAVRGRPAVNWSSELSLAAVIPWDDAVLPGNNLPLTLYWRVGPDGADLSDLRYRLEVVGRDGHMLRAQEGRPGASWLGPAPPGALLREVTSLYIQPDTRPGDYRLRWTLLDGEKSIGEPADSGRIRVEPWPLETEVPAAPYVVKAGFGPDIRLHSYYAGVPTNGLLDLAFYWQASAAPQMDYVVFIHLVDEAGSIVSQLDAIPAGGARPTTGWRAGEVITDIHNLPIPPDLPSGVYYLNVGLYNPDDGTRLPVTVDGAPQPDNRLQLAPTLVLPWGEP